MDWSGQGSVIKVMVVQVVDVVQVEFGVLFRVGLFARLLGEAWHNVMFQVFLVELC